MKHTYTFLVLLFFSNFSFAQELEELSFYPINGIMALEISNDMLFLGSGDLVDISNPFNPTLISQVSISGGVSSLILDEDFAYYGGEMSNKLVIADVSNVGFPLITASFQFTNGHGVFGMDISNDILFLANGSEGDNDGVLSSMDISDKNNPLLLQTLHISDGQCRDVAVKEQYAFIAHYDGLKIVDIGDASNMQVITSIGGGYNSVSIEDDLVCVGKSGGGVDIFDISTPPNPSPLLSIPNSYGTAWSVYLIDSHVYLAANGGGLFVYKISGNSYVEIDNYDEVYGQTFDVAVGDSIIAVPGLIEGVSILAFDTLNFVKTKEIENHFTLTLSPNPFSQQITIDSPDHSIESVKIQNLKGELIDEFFNVTSNHPIDLSFLSSGLYMISIRTSDILQIEKIIKI